MVQNVVLMEIVQTMTFNGVWTQNSIGDFT